MKKTYFEPQVDVNWVTVERNFVATGENLTSRGYGDGSVANEDDDCFWE